MKKTVSKLLSLFIFILLLLWLVDFSVVSVFDTKTLLVLVLGTAILSLADIYGVQSPIKPMKQPFRLLVPIVRKSLMVTGYASTLLLLFFGLKTKNADAISGLIDAGRPLLYAFVLTQLLDLFLDSAPESYPVFSTDHQITKELQSQIKEPSETTGKSKEEAFRSMLLASGLSVREVEIAEQVAQGSTNAEIAERLYISAATVKKHVQRIFEKTGISKREQLMLMRINGVDTPNIHQ